MTVLDEQDELVTIDYAALGLKDHQVLLALWQGSRAQGMSFLHFPKDGSQPDEFAMYEVLHGITGHPYVDYLFGKVIKVNFKDPGDKLFVGLYDRDNGRGAAKRAIESYAASKPKGD